MRLFYPHARRDHRWRDRHHGFIPLHLYADMFTFSPFQSVVNKKQRRLEFQMSELTLFGGAAGFVS
jgi:hypothetical protein